MIYLVFFISLLIIFPLFFTGYFLFDAKDVKLKYVLKIFFIPIIKGYAEFEKNEFIFHLTRKKAIIVPINKIFDVKKNFEPLKDYHLISAKLVVNYSDFDTEINSFAIGFLFNYLSNLFNWFMLNKKPYFRFRTQFNLNLYNSFYLSFNGTVVFNILMVILSFIKIIMEKLVYVFTRKQNKQNNRNNA